MTKNNKQNSNSTNKNCGSSGCSDKVENNKTAKSNSTTKNCK